MQTFLPYEDFKKSAQVLDRQRLGKQRVEVLQILKAITEGKGWVNHPATKMWKNYPICLITYGVAICDEWIARGYKDTCKEKILAFDTLLEDAREPLHAKPSFLGNEKFHASHRAALLVKNFEHYKQYGWTETPEINYMWEELV